MSDAALKLRQAIHAHLAGDGTLGTLLGGPRIHDEAPRGQAGPYLTFETWEAEDASTPECRASRHAITLALWAGPGMASAKTLAIAARVETLLHEAALDPAGPTGSCFSIGRRRKPAVTHRPGRRS